MFSELIDRNNTSFPKELYELIKKIKINENDPLRYHQRIVTEYVLGYNHVRGILIYHKMGSGKTILGVAICEELLKHKKYRRVIFISPKSLHANFKKDYIKYYKLQDKEISEDVFDENYEFVSLNASNMLEQVRRVSKSSDDIISSDKPKVKDATYADLDNTIIVWDEFHNFLNSVKNGSQNAMGLYDIIMNTKNCKLIGMTGTPIINDPYEIALGFNMLAGPMWQRNAKNAQYNTLFGEDYADFARYFTAPNGSMINKDKFQDRILGLVSYYGADSPEFQKLFPAEFEIIVKRIPMSSKQFSSYMIARDSEMEEQRRERFEQQKTRLKKPGGLSSSYRNKSRQFSNILYPEYASKTYKDERGKYHHDKYIDKILPESFDTNKKDGLETWSPKMLEMLAAISLHLPEKMLAKFKPKAAKLKEIIERRSKGNEAQLKKVGLKKWAPGIGPGLVYSQFLDSGIIQFFIET